MAKVELLLTEQISETWSKILETCVRLSCRPKVFDLLSVKKVKSIKSKETCKGGPIC